MKYPRVVSIANMALTFFVGGLMTRVWWEGRLHAWEFFALGVAIVGVAVTDFMRGRISMRDELTKPKGRFE